MRKFALLCFALAFSFLLKFGIKNDAALYTVVARNMAEFGHWWPLQFSPYLFNQFYEHPPLFLWIMGLWSKILPNELASDFFTVLSSVPSRLCAFATLFLGTRFFFKFYTKAHAFCFIAFCASWITWLKYATSAQLDAPLGTCFILLIIYLLIKIKQNEDFKFLTISAILFFALQIKGAAAFGALVIPALFSFYFFKDKQRFKKNMLIGVLTPCFALMNFILFFLLFDLVAESTFSVTYFSRIFNWAFFASGSDLSSSESFQWLNLFGQIGQYFRLEIKHAILWTLPLWGILFYRIALFFRRRNLTYIDFTLLSFVALNIAYIFAKAKMPHWGNATYPVGALALTLTLPFKKDFKFFRSKLYTALCVSSLALIFVIPQYKFRANRGLEYKTYSHFVSQALERQEMIIFLIDPDRYNYNEIAFSALYYHHLDSNFRIEKDISSLNKQNAFHFFCSKQYCEKIEDSLKAAKLQRVVIKKGQSDELQLYTRK